MKHTESFPRFEDLTVPSTPVVIFLDADGTLMPDGDAHVAEGVRVKIQELTARHRVYLTTNTRNVKRKEWFGKTIGIPMVPNHHKKPSKRVLEGVHIIGAPLIVIGDKFLTDELFAKRIGAQFIRVQRKCSGHERVHIRLINLLDDVCFFLYHLFI